MEATAHMLGSDGYHLREKGSYHRMNMDLKEEKARYASGEAMSEKL